MNFRNKLIGIVLAVAIFGSQASLLAGNYSSATANTTPGAIDAGIAGFVGSAGEGVAATKDTETTKANGNYVNPTFVGWAKSVIDYSPAPGVSTDWQTKSNALGAVTGDNFNIVSLGDLYTTNILTKIDPKATGDSYGFIGYDNPGKITLSFDCNISNGDGADFAVFENGMISSSKLFAELAYVEVSSDGKNFARFDSISGTASAVGTFSTIDPTDVYNLAGKHANGSTNSWGTPFDLETLKNNAMVTSGLVDLNNIKYIRIVDIPGSGDYLDSQGNPIYDAWVTIGSGGFDLEAIGVIRHFGETQTAKAGDGALGWSWNSSNGAIRLEYAGLSADSDFTAQTWSNTNAIALLTDVDELVGTDYQLLDVWKIEAPNAAFTTGGGITLFAYFDSSFTGDEDDLMLLRWTGNEWVTAGISSVDLDKFIMESSLQPGSQSWIYAVVAIYLLPGDADGNHNVNIKDLSVLAANYGVSNATWAMGDFDGDKVVGVIDLSMLAANYDKGTGEATSFAADYAQVFGTTTDLDDATEDETENATDDETGNTLCSSLGLSLIALLAMMGVNFTRLEE
jgi:hypothetical protein